MEFLNGHFRHVPLYHFRKGRIAMRVGRKLFDVYGERQCQNWSAFSHSVCENVERKKSWSNREESVKSAPEADIHRKKDILSIWRNFKSMYCSFRAAFKKPNYRYGMYWRSLLLQFLLEIYLDEEQLSFLSGYLSKVCYLQ